VTAFQNIGGIQQPVISQRKIEHQIRLRNGEVSVLGGLVQHTTTKSTAGWPGLSKVPFLRYFFSNQHTEEKDDEVLIVLTPHVVRMPDISSEDMRSLFTGTAQNVEVLQKTAPAPGAAPPAAPTGAAAAPGKAAPAPAQAATAPAGLLRFQPATVSVQPGQTTTIALVVQNATDLFSIPMILHFDPKVISIEDVRNGGFLAGGTEAIAIFHRTDPVKGDVIMSATRQPKTAGVSGSGTLLGIVVKGLAPGTSPLTIEQVSARNSRQKPLTFQTQPATIHVGPKP
jgi:general secretion pathway protein D